ncbi:hypothetical protein [Aquimarina algiphila]|uniref:hypothetical protein n=1 Tax=Aquimarina algiphila TaxID=2047982 RepID=UPI00232F5D9E|nr:hypothetical protein [Aquimarina algiphila]
MKHLFTFLFLSIIFFGCSSDDDPIVDEPDGNEVVGEEDTILLTVSRGANSSLRFNEEIKDLSLEAIITGEDGTILARNSIETNTEVKLEAEYDKNKPYHLHFVLRYIESDTEPEFRYENVVRYFVQTFLDVSNREYFYDLDIDRGTAIGTAELKFENVPFSFLNASHSTSFGSSTSSSLPIVDNRLNFEIKVKQNGVNTVYAYAQSEDPGNEDFRYTRQELSNGQLVSLDYNTLPKAKQVKINFPDLSSSNSTFRRFTSSISGVDLSKNTDFFRFDSSLLFATDELSKEFFLPENIFERYSFFGTASYDNFITHTRDFYAIINDIPKMYVPSSLNASITNNSFLSYQATVTGEYDYFNFAAGYSDGDNILSTTKRFNWVIYNGATPSISITLKDLISEFIKKEDGFNITAENLGTPQLSIYKSSEINSKDDFIDMVINRNRSKNLRNIPYERWISVDRVDSRTLNKHFPIDNKYSKEYEDDYLN